MSPWFFRLLVASFATVFLACSSDVEDLIDDIEDAVDLADGVPRKPIDRSRMGVNAFSNQAFAGGIRDQFLEIRDTLGLTRVRVLMAWDDAVQPSPGATPNFSFYETIVRRLPSNMQALVVLTGVPSWVNDPANWVDGNPRKTFVELFVKKIVGRFAGNPKITAWQIWNEPNMVANSQNGLLGLDSDAANYVEMLAMASDFIRGADPGTRVINAATTSIVQNFPDTLRYNKAMRDAGVEAFIDFFAIHYYGRQFENVKRSNGVEEFLEGLSKRIWITETGRMGVNEQLPYVEQVWPFLREEIGDNQIDLIFFYRFAEDSPSDISFGLKTPDPSFPVSDLYISLRDQK